MPFKSKAQRRWMFANHPKMAKRWADHTPKGEDLPEYVDEANVPKMSQVFSIREMHQDIVHGPPMGSVPAKDDIWNGLGKAGETAHKGLEGINAGTNLGYEPMLTPDGQILAYPKDKRPGSTPLRANIVQGGSWVPVSGAQSGSLDGGTM